MLSLALVLALGPASALARDVEVSGSDGDQGSAGVSGTPGGAGGAGGAGGSVSVLLETLDARNTADVTGGAGGDALATATAVGAGPARVAARAQAFAGLGAFGSSATGADGAATATSSATGLGEVEARSEASGLEARSAMATARSSGRIVSTTARVTAASGSEGRLDAIAALQSDLDPGTVRLFPNFERAGLAAAITPPEEAPRLFLDPPESLASGALGVGLATSEFEAAVGYLFGEDAPETVIIGFERTVFSGEGFETLSLDFLVAGDLAESLFFDDLQEAVDFFDDAMVRLNLDGARDIELVLGATVAGEGDAFQLDFVLMVPEPSTGALLAIGLVLLAVVRRAAAQASVFSRI